MVETPPKWKSDKDKDGWIKINFDWTLKYLWISLSMAFKNLFYIFSQLNVSIINNVYKMSVITMFKLKLKQKKDW